MRLTVIAVALLAACSGGSKSTATPANNSTPGSAKPDPILASLLASELPLTTEPHQQSDCSGAPTLGKLVQKELDAHPQGPITTKCIPAGSDDFQCTVFMGADPVNPDPTDPDYKVTQFSVVWFASKADGSGLRTTETLECGWR